MGNKKINISANVSEDLFEKIENYCNKVGVGKASLIRLALNTYIDQQNAIESLPSDMKDFVDTIKKLNDKQNNEYK